MPLPAKIGHNFLAGAGMMGEGSEASDNKRLQEAEPQSVASTNLAYELQSKLFEQLAAMGVAGAGLVITLKGSILSGASGLIWIATAEFALGAFVAFGAQLILIEGLFAANLSRRRLQIMLIIAVLLIGMGICSLGMSVFLEGKS